MPSKRRHEAGIGIGPVRRMCIAVEAGGGEAKRQHCFFRSAWLHPRNGRDVGDADMRPFRVTGVPIPAQCTVPSAMPI